MTLRSTLLVAVWLLATGGAARAQNDAFTLPVERFRPPIDGGGFATVEAGAIPSHLGFQLGLVTSYTLNPLVLRNGAGDPIAGIISHRVAGDALFSIGLFDYVSLGLDLPMTFAQVGGDVPADLAAVVGVANGLAGTGLGDLRLVPKVRVLREDRHGVSLALIPAVTFPTAGGLLIGAGEVRYDYGGSYLGEGPGAFAFIPELAVSTNVAGVRLAANLAYRLRQPVRYLGAIAINPEIVYRAGVGYDVAAAVPSLGSVLLFVEAFGSTPDRNPFGLVKDAGASEEEQNIAALEARLTNPLEWAGGVRAALGSSVSVEAGVGSGLAPGYGSPDLRVYAGLRFTADDRDRDDDGVEDAADACPDDPEDKDRHDDGDGCPDPDNDGDGLPDSLDGCRDAGEDLDGWQDADGCPEADNDDDGVADDDDRCPTEKGAAAFAGCPAPDRDKDGVADAQDLCPDVPGVPALGGCPDGDGDAVADEQDRCPEEAGVPPSGCADKDNDGIRDVDDRCPTVAGVLELRGCADGDKDGIADPDDKCPAEPEVINGVEDADGCPDKGKVLVTVTRERIELSETVFFDTGKATIQRRSFGLLDQVALVLKAHPEVKKVSVEGHTDDKGADERNLDLSRQRAASVRQYLVDRGIDAERLVSDGFGETRPIADNRAAKGREQNRRVELRIVEQP